MASLQQTLISLQPKLPLSSARARSTLPARVCLPIRSSRREGAAAGVRTSATVAGSYATALADVAKANNTLDSTCADVEKLEKVFSDPKILDFFANPTVDLSKKREVLDEMAQSSALLPHTANFLNVLVDRKRVDLVNEIVREFETVYNKMTATELAVVSSVVKLESQHLAQIAKQVQKLTGVKNVRIKTVIDPSLVAGFTVRYGNSGSKLIDMSVRKQLEDIASQLEFGDIQFAV